MTGSEGHYRRTVEEGGRTRFARCGFLDRFDPFRLSAVPRIASLYRDLFNEFLGEEPCGRLLDAGCGTGLYFELLARHAVRVDAVDASPEMMNIAREFAAARGLSHVYPGMGAMEALPFGDNEFDVVVALDALHHVSNVDGALAEVFRVLKPGGRFMVFEPNICNPLMWLAHALPREERLALERNTPARMKRLLESRFQTRRWRGICELVTETTGIKRRILDACLGCWRRSGWEYIYPRQAWLGEKVP